MVTRVSEITCSVHSAMRKLFCSKLDNDKAESKELSEHEKFILSQMVNSDTKTIEEISLMHQKQLAEIYQHCGCQKIEPQESEG